MVDITVNMRDFNPDRRTLSEAIKILDYLAGNKDRVAHMTVCGLRIDIKYFNGNYFFEAKETGEKGLHDRPDALIIFSHLLSVDPGMALTLRKQIVGNQQDNENINSWITALNKAYQTESAFDKIIDKYNQ